MEMKRVFNTEMHMSNFPITGWPADVIEPIKDKIWDFIERREVVEFYIGRTNNLINTKSRHGCDKIFELYETDGTDNAIEVEDVLIKTFHEHPKCSNDAKHGGGGASDEYVNYVYIAVWFKSQRQQPLTKKG